METLITWWSQENNEIKLPHSNLENKWNLNTNCSRERSVY